MIRRLPNSCAYCGNSSSNHRMIGGHDFTPLSPRGDTVSTPRMTEKQREALRRLRDALNDLDDQTRQSGERPLTEIVAEHAREELRKLDETRGGTP